MRQDKLLIPLAILVVSHAAFSQPATPSAISKQPEEKTVFSNTIYVKEPRESGFKTNEGAFTITADDIAESASLSVDELLEKDPSVYVSSGSRGEATYRLRGLHQRQTTLMLDGVPVAAPYNGLLDAGKLPSAFASEIQVQKRGRTARNGHEGMGGYINIITVRPPEKGYSASAIFDRRSDGAYSLNIGQGEAFGPLSYYLYFGGLETDGFKPANGVDMSAVDDDGRRLNSDKKTAFLAGKFVLSLPYQQKLYAAVHYINGEFGIPPAVGVSSARFWRFNDWRHTTAQIGYSVSPVQPLQLSAKAYIDRYYNTLDAFDDGDYTAQTLATSFSSTYDDSSAALELDAEIFFTDSRAYHYQWYIWYTFTHSRHKNIYSDSNDAQSAWDFISNSGAYFNFAMPAGYFAEAGLRSQEQWVYSDEMDFEYKDLVPYYSLEPYIENGFAADNGLIFSLLLSRKERFPTLKERFSEARGFRVPNTALGTEKSYTAEASAEYKPGGGTNLFIDIFGGRVYDYIVETKTDEGLLKLGNVGPVSRVGLEAGAAYSPFYFWENRLTGAFVHTRRCDAPDGNDYIESVPLYKAVLAERFRFFKGFKTGFELNLTGRQYSLHPDTNEWMKLSGFMLVSAFISYSYQGVTVSARADNITDVNYMRRYAYPSAGRFFSLTAAFTPAFDR